MQFQDLYIVRENPILIQRLAKEHIKPVLSKYLIGCIIFYAVLNWTPNILGIFISTPIWNYLNISQAGIDTKDLPQYPAILFLYAFIFQGVMELGKSLYVMTIVRNRSAEYGALFEGFKLYAKALALSIVKSVIVTLWTFVFIIPGIIANYGFSQAYFILADDPNKGVMQCLAESKMRMSGNKLNLFRLDLSYLAYVILAYIPGMLIGDLGLVDSSTLPGILVFIVAEIPLVCALGFLYVGRGVFYELLMSHGFENFKFENQEVFRTKGVQTQEV